MQIIVDFLSLITYRYYYNVQQNATKEYGALVHGLLNKLCVCFHADSYGYFAQNTFYTRYKAQNEFVNLFTFKEKKQRLEMCKYKE